VRLRLGNLCRLRLQQNSLKTAAADLAALAFAKQGCLQLATKCCWALLQQVSRSKGVPDYQCSFSGTR
jgi:hypothetical protein